MVHTNHNIFFCHGRVFKGGLCLADVSKMLNSFETPQPNEMLLRAFPESGNLNISTKFGRTGDMSESGVFNNMRHMDEMLLVFDGLDNFNVPQPKQNGNSNGRSRDCYKQLFLIYH